ncbi:ComF family protein [Fulvivirga imtechensis]|nr:ComF family protein [Fulvivirga imtechensis]
MACGNSLVKGEEVICLKCDYEMPRTESHEDAQNFVAIKFYGKVRLTDAVACYKFSKHGKVQKLLHRLKYDGKPSIGEFIGRKYGIELRDNGFSECYDLIVPVPLHKIKLRRRKYNQSAVFADGLSQSLGLPFSDRHLVRTIKTSTQTRKSRFERWRNVESIFEINYPEVLKEKRILLVDDVITTGSTIESCANALLSAGCRSVGVAAIAAAK